MKIRLNKLVTISFVILLITIIGVLFIQYKYSKNQIVDKYTNHYYSQSLQVREKLRVILDKVQYDFKKIETENIQKLNELYKIYEHTNKNFNSDDVVKQLNKNVKFGKYQIFLINKNNIIEKSSYKPDLGLNLGQFKYIEVLFRKLYNKQIEIDISVPILDTLSMNLKKYLIRLSHDDKYILQVAFVIDFKEILKEIHKTSSINTKSLDIYFATEFTFQKVQITKSILKKYNLIEYNKDTNMFFTKINQHLQDKNIERIINSDIKKDAINYNIILSDIFNTKDKLLYFLDDKRKSINYYSVSNGIFNIKDEFKIIINLDFSMDELNKDLDEIFNYFIILIGIVIFVFVIIYLFVLFNISNKLVHLHDNIKSNTLSKKENLIVREIYELTNSYNQLNTNLNEQIKINMNLSYIDCLTQTKNRKAYDEKITELLSLFRRYKTPFSIAMLDIDNFKSINDNYGHKIGDDVLIKMTQLIHKNMRESDFLYRIGGEEFILIYTQTQFPNSLLITEKIRKLIEKDLNTIDNKSITVSIGLTEVENNDTEDLIYQRVDKFLYTSKNSGKNKITHTI